MPHAVIQSRSLRKSRKARWMKAGADIWGEDASADTTGDETDQQHNAKGAVDHPVPSSMNAFASQPVRQAPRLQNTQKAGLGNGLGSGWAMGASSAGSAFASAAVVGGIGGAPGLGQPRPGQLSGFAQVMGGGGGQAPIDLSDFPSLSGGPRTQTNAAAASWNSNAIRQPSISQPPLQQPVQQRAPSAAPSQHSQDQYDTQRLQQQPTERANGSEEFPPLSGQLNGDSQSQNNDVPTVLGSPDVVHQRPNGQQTAQLPIRDASNGLYQGQQAPIGSGQLQAGPLQNGQPAPASTTKKYSDMTENEKWGLQGLMAAYEARRQTEIGGQPDESVPANMRSAVFMGQDLSPLDLDLDSVEPLYPTFTPFPHVSGSGSAFDFHDKHIVPDFTLPNAYTVTNVPPAAARMGAFSDETLFSIFYQHPRDVLQELSAIQLSNRGWFWHKVLRQWLSVDKRDGNSTSSSSLPLVDLAAAVPIGTTPVRQSERTERGVYVFFDAANWRRERREFVLEYEQLDHRQTGPAAVSPMPTLSGQREGSAGGSSQVLNA